MPVINQVWSYVIDLRRVLSRVISSSSISDRYIVIYFEIFLSRLYIFSSVSLRSDNILIYQMSISVLYRSKQDYTDKTLCAVRAERGREYRNMTAWTNLAPNAVSKYALSFTFAVF